MPNPFDSNPFQTLQDFVAQTPLNDIERNVKALIAQGLSKCDLVTREEFDIQVALVNQLRERIEKLEQQLKETT